MGHASNIHDKGPYEQACKQHGILRPTWNATRKESAVPTAQPTTTDEITEITCRTSLEGDVGLYAHELGVDSGALLKTLRQDLPGPGLTDSSVAAVPMTTVDTPPSTSNVIDKIGSVTVKTCSVRDDSYADHSDNTG